MSSQQPLNAVNALNANDLLLSKINISALSTDLRWPASTMDAMLSLAKRVQAMQAEVPASNANADTDSWPLAYIDPILVARGELLEATIPLSYLEGFPTVDGVPFWERLENESLDYYRLFKTYRDMKETKGVRSLPAAAKLANVNPNVLQRIGAMYHWALRCKTYDAYQLQELEQYRVRKIEKLQNHHYENAEEMMRIAMRQLKNQQELMEPKDAIKLAQTAAELARLSLGLNPKKPESEVQAMNAAGTQPLIQINNTGGGGDSGRGESANERVSSILTVLAQSGALQQELERLERKNVTIDADSGQEV